MVIWASLDGRWLCWRPADRHRPPGRWQQFLGADEVTGLGHRPADALAFVDGVTTAEDRHFDWGIELEPDPQEGDRNAIRISAYWQAPAGRFNRSPSPTLCRRHIGFVEPDLAAQIARLPPDLPIAAELYEIAKLRDATEAADTCPVTARVIILVPAGY